LSAAATPGAHWHSEELAASFAERRRILIPLLDVQEDVLRRLLDRHGRPVANAVRAERESGGTRHEHEVDLEDDDDRPDTVEDQLRWLRDAGFEQVEVHFKWAEAAIYGGARPVKAT
jgi:hypothetical protein